MSIADDIKTVRARGMSRRALGTLVDLTEGVIWRIENKGTCSDSERAVLQPELDQLLGRDGSVSASTVAGNVADDGAGAQPNGVPGHAPARPSVADPTSAPAVPPSQLLTQLGPPPPTDGKVGWTQLQAVAAGVSEHDIERGQYIGPDAASDFRFVSNSEVQTFKDCRRKWWLAYYRKLGLKVESPLGPRAIGDRVHRALKAWYTPDGTARTDPRTALEQLIISDWSQLTVSLSDEPERLANLQKKFNDEATLERAMLEGYMQWLSDTGADGDLRVVASETYLEAEVTDDLIPHKKPVKIIGKLDVRVTRVTDGVRKFLDHKTVAEFTTLRQIVNLDEQMLHYHLLEWLTTGEGEARCDGALYNMLRKVKRTGNAKPPFYDRIEVSHNERTLESFKKRLLGSVDDMLLVEEALDSGHDPLSIVYPRPTRDCRWKCDFFAVCPMFDDGSRVDAMLLAWYTKRDPLAYYGSQQEEGDL